MMVNKNQTSRKYFISATALMLAGLVVLFLARPQEVFTDIEFANKMKAALKKDVGMFAPKILNGVKDNYIFVPAAVNSLVTFNNPPNLSALIFYRDNVLTYSSNKITVKDKTGNLLTTIPLGKTVSLSFPKSDTPEGRFFKVPAITQEYFVIGLNGKAIVSVALLSPPDTTNTLSSSWSQYGNLVPMVEVSAIDSVSPITSSSAYSDLGEVINWSLSLVNSVTATERSNASAALTSALNRGVNALNKNSDIPDELKNTIAQVYAEFHALTSGNISDTDGKYSSLITGVQIELASQIIQKTRLNSGTSIATSTNSKVATVGNTTTSSDATSNGSSTAKAAVVQSALTAPSTPVPSASPGLVLVSTPVGGTYKEPNLTIPANANVSTTSISAPCDSSKGDLPHYLTRRECTGANILTIPLGIFNLTYNSVKPSDKVFGLVGWKFSFHEYIDLAKLVYVTSTDRSIALTKSGEILKPTSFTWGDYEFSITGASIVRLDTKAGLKYTYAKSSASDPLYRLSLVEKTADNSKVLALGFSSNRDPAYADFLDNKNAVSRVAFTKPNARSIKLDYPDGSYPDVTITYKGPSIFSVKYDKTQIDYRIVKSNSGSEYPISQSWYYTDTVPANSTTNHKFFGYDSVGHIVRSESKYYGIYDKAMVHISTDITYPQSGNYHHVISKSPVSKSDNWYSTYGPYVLRAASSGPFGQDAYRYFGSPHYALSKVWEASRNAWTLEVTKYTEQEAEVKSPTSIVSTSKSGNVYTSTVKDLSGAELSKSIYTEKPEGQYASTVVSGQLEVRNTYDKVAGEGNLRNTTSQTKVAGGVVYYTDTLRSDTLTQVKDMLTGAVSKVSVEGDITKQTYTSPGKPQYQTVTTNTTSGNSSSSEWVSYENNTILSKGKSSVAKVGAGTATNTITYQEVNTPVSGAKTWERNSSTHSDLAKQTKTTQSRVPASEIK